MIITLAPFTEEVRLNRDSRQYKVQVKGFDKEGNQVWRSETFHNRLESAIKDAVMRVTLTGPEKMSLGGFIQRHTECMESIRELCKEI